jgi:prepilin-type processing-associated H-X9-DG protein
MKNLALACHGYHDANKKFPPGAQAAVFISPNPTGSTSTIQGTSWIVFVLPYIEQGPLYQKYDFTQAYNTGTNGTVVAATVIPVLYCPNFGEPKRWLDPNAGVTTAVSTNYYGVMGPCGPTNPSPYVYGATTYNATVGSAGSNGAWSAHGVLSHYQDATGSVSTNRLITMTEILDGTSNTLLLGERSMPPTLGGAPLDYRSWTRGNNGGAGACLCVTYPINSTYYNGSTNFNERSFGSTHGGGGCNFALADGTVRFVQQDTDINLLKALSTINLNEPASLP